MGKEKWGDIWGSEWDYVVRLGSAISDPHDKKEFWENIKARKLADPSFSIYSLFPRSDSTTKRAMKECVDFVMSVTKRDSMPERNASGGDKELCEVFGRLIEEGKHLPPKVGA